jgi:hypothetical protein
VVEGLTISLERGGNESLIRIVRPRIRAGGARRESRQILLKEF